MRDVDIRKQSSVWELGIHTSHIIAMALDPNKHRAMHRAILNICDRLWSLLAMGQPSQRPFVFLGVLPLHVRLMERKKYLKNFVRKAVINNNLRLFFD